MAKKQLLGRALGRRPSELDAAAQRDWERSSAQSSRLVREHLMRAGTPRAEVDAYLRRTFCID